MAKYRYFCFVVYPDSVPDNWVDILKETRGAYAISPLHIPDDEDKKPHYHVLYRHGNSIDLNSFSKILPGGIAANNYFQGVSAPRGYQRYLLHLDDPDKQQFEGGITEITTLNGFPLDLSRDYSKSELNEFRDQIFEFINENDIYEYCDLIDALFGNIDLLDYACGHTVLFDKYLASRRYKKGGDQCVKEG